MANPRALAVAATCLTSYSEIHLLGVAVLPEVRRQLEHGHRRGLWDLAEYGHGCGCVPGGEVLQAEEGRFDAAEIREQAG